METFEDKLDSLRIKISEHEEATASQMELMRSQMLAFDVEHQQQIELFRRENFLIHEEELKIQQKIRELTKSISHLAQVILEKQGVQNPSEVASQLFDVMPESIEKKSLQHTFQVFDEMPKKNLQGQTEDELEQSSLRKQVTTEVVEGHSEALKLQMEKVIPSINESYSLPFSITDLKHEPQSIARSYIPNNLKPNPTFRSPLTITSWTRNTANKSDVDLFNIQGQNLMYQNAYELKIECSYMPFAPKNPILGNSLTNTKDTSPNKLNLGAEANLIAKEGLMFTTARPPSIFDKLLDNPDPVEMGLYDGGGLQTKNHHVGNLSKVDENIILQLFGRWEPISRVKMKGPLARILVVVKDMDMPSTTGGYRFLENYQGFYGVTSVKILKGKDVIVIGKTNLDGIGMRRIPGGFAVITTKEQQKQLQLMQHCITSLIRRDPNHAALTWYIDATGPHDVEKDVNSSPTQKSSLVDSSSICGQASLQSKPALCGSPVPCYILGDKNALNGRVLKLIGGSERDVPGTNCIEKAAHVNSRHGEKNLLMVHVLEKSWIELLINCGVLAYIHLGVDYNEDSGDRALLMLELCKQWKDIAARFVALFSAIVNCGSVSVVDMLMPIVFFGLTVGIVFFGLTVGIMFPYRVPDMTMKSVGSALLAFFADSLHLQYMWKLDCVTVLLAALNDSPKVRTYVGITFGKLNSLAHQVNVALATCNSLKLDGLVIIGGVTPNTNAALLAKTFVVAKCPTKVAGVFVTLNGDQKNQFVETNVGSNKISTLMDLKALHVALEYTLQSHPNMPKAAQDKYHGVILLPKGLLESILEVYALWKGIYNWLRQGITLNNISFQLSPWASALFEFLPLFIKKQPLLYPESKDSARLSLIETETMKHIAHLVEVETYTRQMKDILLLNRLQVCSAIVAIFRRLDSMRWLIHVEWKPYSKRKIKEQLEHYLGKSFHVGTLIFGYVLSLGQEYAKREGIVTSTFKFAAFPIQIQWAVSVSKPFQVH